MLRVIGTSTNVAHTHGLYCHARDELTSGAKTEGMPQVTSLQRQCHGLLTQRPKPCVQVSGQCLHLAKKNEEGCHDYRIHTTSVLYMHHQQSQGADSVGRSSVPVPLA